MKFKERARPESVSAPLPAALQATPVLAEYDRLHEEMVRELAYQLYEQRGCMEGYDLQDWFEAEAILRQRGLAA